MPIPTFASVPDSWKFPYGPYVQAPAEHGGEWWPKNPFYGDEPWLSRAPEVVYPEGFLEVFPEPVASDFQDYPVPVNAFKTARSMWEGERARFKRGGYPEGMDASSFDRVRPALLHWGLNDPVLYESTYGWVVTFPDNDFGVVAFKSSIELVLEQVDLVIAAFVLRAMRDDIYTGPPYPLIRIQEEEEDEEEEENETDEE